MGLVGILKGAVKGAIGGAVGGGLTPTAPAGLSGVAQAVGEALSGTSQGSLARDTAQIEADTKRHLSDNRLREKQVDLNMVDAKSGNMWAAGWRPGLGWSIVLIFTFDFFVSRVAEQFFGVARVPLEPEEQKIVYGVLGTLLGGTVILRSAEKWKGVATAVVGRLRGK